MSRARLLCQARRGSRSWSGRLPAAVPTSTVSTIPFLTGSTANQREIIGSGQPMPAPVPTHDDAVTRSDLPPPAGAPASTVRFRRPLYPPRRQAAGSCQRNAIRLVSYGRRGDCGRPRPIARDPVDQVWRSGTPRSPRPTRSTARPMFTPARSWSSRSGSGDGGPGRARGPCISPGHAGCRCGSSGHQSQGRRSSIHLVEPGQTLYSIAHQYGARVDEIISP